MLFGKSQFHLFNLQVKVQLFLINVLDSLNVLGHSFF